MQSTRERLDHFGTSPNAFGNMTESTRPTEHISLRRQKSLMVDAGGLPDHAREFLRMVKRTGFPIPSLTVLTHHHWDHSFGGYAVPRSLAANTITKGYLERYSEYEWDDKDVDERVATGIECAFVAKSIKLECLTNRTLPFVFLAAQSSMMKSSIWAVCASGQNTSRAITVTIAWPSRW